MKKVIIVLLQIILFCFLSGCTKISGLNEQLIVNGIGVDKIDNEYEVTVQALNIKNTSEEDSNEENQLININASGESLLDAVNNIENKTGKEILYSHNLILVIGDNASKTGISDIINFFATSHKLRPTVEVLISNTSAKELFFIENSDKQINSEDILSITMLGKEGDDGIHSNMRYLLSDINNSTKGAKAWYIELNKDNSISCQKIAVFKDDKLACILDNEITQAVLLIYGKAKNISQNIRIGEKIISYDVNKVQSDINAKIQEGKPIFNINMNISVDLYNTDNINSDTEKIKSAICEKLNIIINSAIDKCIKEYKCDIFNLNRYVMNTDLNYFKSNINNMDEILNSSEYNIKTNAKVKYTGPNQKINSLIY